MNRVLTDRDAVVVGELLFLDGLAIDESAVRASKVDDPELLAAALNSGVVPAGRGVAKDEVVVWGPPQAQRGLTGAVVVPRVRS